MTNSQVDAARLRELRDDVAECQRQTESWLTDYERGRGYISIPTHQIERLDRIAREALASSPVASPIDYGEDWQLVPKAATEAMLRAAVKHGDSLDPDVGYSVIWKTMLAAAPTQPLAGSAIGYCKEGVTHVTDLILAFIAGMLVAAIIFLSFMAELGGNLTP